MSRATAFSAHTPSPSLRIYENIYATLNPSLTIIHAQCHIRVFLAEICVQECARMYAYIHIAMHVRRQINSHRNLHSNTHSRMRTHARTHASKHARAHTHTHLLDNIYRRWHAVVHYSRAWPRNHICFKCTCQVCMQSPLWPRAHGHG